MDDPMNTTGDNSSPEGQSTRPWWDQIKQAPNDHQKQMLSAVLSLQNAKDSAEMNRCVQFLLGVADAAFGKGVSEHKTQELQRQLATYVQRVAEQDKKITDLEANLEQSEGKHDAQDPFASTTPRKRKRNELLEMLCPRIPDIESVQIPTERDRILAEAVTNPILQSKFRIAKNCEETLYATTVPDLENQLKCARMALETANKKVVLQLKKYNAESNHGKTLLRALKLAKAIDADRVAKDERALKRPRLTLVDDEAEEDNSENPP